MGSGQEAQAQSSGLQRHSALTGLQRAGGQGRRPSGSAVRRSGCSLRTRMRRPCRPRRPRCPRRRGAGPAARPPGCSPDRPHRQHRPHHPHRPHRPRRPLRPRRPRRPRRSTCAPAPARPPAPTARPAPGRPAARPPGCSPDRPHRPRRPRRGTRLVANGVCSRDSTAMLYSASVWFLFGGFSRLVGSKKASGTVIFAKGDSFTTKSVF